MYRGRETGENNVTYQIYGEDYLSVCAEREGIIETMAKVFICEFQHGMYRGRKWMKIK